jgi:hypothetical protein
MVERIEFKLIREIVMGRPEHVEQTDYNSDSLLFKS